MWVALAIALVFAALVAWRVLVVVRRRGEPSRPIDRGHPHLSDVDPHDSPGPRA